MNDLRKIIYSIIAISLICLVSALAYKHSYSKGFNAGELAERTKIDAVVKEKLDKQNKELTEFYKAQLDLEKKNVKTEIVYVEAKTKIEELKKKDKSVGISVETANELNDIFKDLK